MLNQLNHGPILVQKLGYHEALSENAREIYNAKPIKISLRLISLRWGGSLVIEIDIAKQSNYFLCL